MGDAWTPGLELWCEDGPFWFSTFQTLCPGHGQLDGPANPEVAMLTKKIFFSLVSPDCPKPHFKQGLWASGSVAHLVLFCF